jgi:hypothetical protein
MTKGDETPGTYFSDLFERARRALSDHNGGDAVVFDPQSVDASASTNPGGVAAQLRIDDRTREVFIRLYDVHTGTTIREVRPAEVAAAAARLRAPVA